MQGCYLYRTTQTLNERGQISMSRFEPTIPAYEQARTFHAVVRFVFRIGKIGTELRILLIYARMKWFMVRSRCWLLSEM
jgi:hypothetical protein